MPWMRTGATKNLQLPTSGYASGPLDTDILTIDYSGCSKSILTYNGSGELAGEDVEYEDGTGTIVFKEDGTFSWHEDQSETGKDRVFELLPPAEG